MRERAVWLWEGRPDLAGEEQVKRQGVQGREWPGWSWVRKGRAVGQRGDSEQDAQGLLGHRKDLTGSQTSDVICLRFYQDF